MTELVSALSRRPASHPRRIRVMIVDDAVVVRGLLSRWLTEAGDIEIASTHRTGAEAVDAIDFVKPDVILLDIEMPDMDGIAALPLLLKKRPSTTVIVASTLTTRNADISLRCLDLGATDYIAKPSTNRDVTFSVDFRRDIIDKIRTLGQRTMLGHLPQRRGLADATGVERPVQALGPGESTIVLRPFIRIVPRVLVIGASTGGPNAVTALLKLCRPAIERVPVIIAQHMPTMFTAMFADHLGRQLGLPSQEAKDGALIEPGRIYVAPGGKHLCARREASAAHIVIDDAPAENFCKPSVDITMSSFSTVYGSGALAIMLTGMGSDGLRGASEIVENGGNLLAQDEASSVVWGMPGVVAKRGLCAAVGPIETLARIVNLSTGAVQP